MPQHTTPSASWPPPDHQVPVFRVPDKWDRPVGSMPFASFTSQPRYDASTATGTYPPASNATTTSPPGFQNPLQPTHVWVQNYGQQQCHDTLQPGSMQLPGPPVPMQQPQVLMNLAPPVMSPAQPNVAQQPLTSAPYSTTVDVSPILTPGGHCQIQGMLHNYYNSYYNEYSTCPSLPGYGHLAPLLDSANFSDFTHLDLADFLPTSTIAVIGSRAYIDFDKLLPDNVDDPWFKNRQANLAEVAGLKLGVTTKKGKPKEIDGIIKCIRVFAIWTFIYLDSNPKEGKGLFQYLNHILDADK